MTVIDDRALRRLRGAGGRLGPGDVVDGRFEIQHRMGRGAMGVVYAAFDRDLERVVALKLVDADDEHVVARWAREAEALEAVEHPAVVTYVAHGEAESGQVYVAMEQLHGMTLEARLRGGKKLSVADTVALGQRLVEGLAAVHAEGLAHRDLKPANVFLLDGDVARAQLIDFGLARRLAPEARVTVTGALVGTPGYMAPEQVRGEDVDGRADVFALGCVLYECLAGRPAFAADDTEVLLSKLLVEAPTPVEHDCPSTPETLAETIAAMLAKAARDRPTAAELERSWPRIVAGQAPTASSGSGGGVTLLEPGSWVADKYEIVDRLGEGGMGVVYEARHRELGQRVAIKVMQRRDSVDETRLLREARATSRLTSPHALRILDVGRLDDGAPFMVMERLVGRDLAEVLQENGPLPIDDAVAWVLDAAEAIGEAHELGIVHRDLKPSNLFLAEQRGQTTVKVLDFGISKLTRPLDEGTSAPTLTSDGGVVGSVAYMSPEQLRGADVDSRSDIWSLGVVLFELLSGRLPFDGEGAAAIGARIASEPAPDLRGLRPDTPPKLADVVARCLSKRPRDRYADVQALVAALRARRAPASRRRGWMGGVIALGAAGLVWMLTTGPSSSPAPPASRDAADLPVSDNTPTVAPDAGAVPTSEGSRASSPGLPAPAATAATSKPAPAGRPVRASPPLRASPSAPMVSPPPVEPTSVPVPVPSVVDVTDPALVPW